MNQTITAERLDEIARCYFEYVRSTTSPKRGIPESDYFRKLVVGMMNGRYSVKITRTWFAKFLKHGRKAGFTADEIKFFTRIMLNEYIEKCRKNFLS